jgi:hypothetical protein
VEAVAVTVAAALVRASGATSCTRDAVAVAGEPTSAGVCAAAACLRRAS